MTPTDRSTTPSVVHSFSSRDGQDHDRISAMPTASAGGGGSGGSDGEFEITMSQRILSAFTGSTLVSLLVTPLDVVRVRLQAQTHTAPSTVDFARLAKTTHSLTPAQIPELGVTACCREVFFAGNQAEYCLAGPVTSTPATADCAVHEVQKRTFSSTLDGLRKIARNEGVTTLWRGLSPTLVMAVPGNIIYFTGYDWLRYNPASPLAHLGDDNAPLTAGSLARVWAAAAVGPIELVRTRMQAGTSSGPSSASPTSSNHMVAAFRNLGSMVGTHGYSSLWRGLTLTLWRDVPFSGLYWWGYESIRARITDMREAQNVESRGRSFSRSSSSRNERSEARRRSRSRENRTETFVDSFAAGALSGTFASIVTMPFDVGKTRTQVYRDSAQAGQSGVVGMERSMVRLLWHIFQTEGVAGLWKGWIPRTLKVAPSCAIMISTYEVAKRVFRGVNERAAAREAGEGA